MKTDEIVKLLELFELFNFNIKELEEDIKILKNYLKKKEKEKDY